MSDSKKYQVKVFSARAKIFTALVSLLSAAIVGITTYIVTRDRTVKEFMDRIEHLTRESEALKHASGALKHAKEAAELQVQRLAPALDDLQKSYQDLGIRYGRCTNTKGMTFEKTVEMKWLKTDLNTGDRVALHFTDSTVVMRLLRVTMQGAVFKLEQCDRPVFLSSITRSAEEDGTAALVLLRGQDISIATGCCSQGGTDCYSRDLETGVVVCSTFDIEHQSATLHYRKVFLPVPQKRR